MVQNNDLRRMWDDSMHYDSNNRKNKDDRNSLKHCRNSAYRFFIHYIDGANYTFEQLINYDNAVRIKTLY